VKVDETLVDFELEFIPGLGTFTTGGFAGGDAEDLGGETDGALHAEVTVSATSNEVTRELLKVSNVTARKCNPDLVRLCSRDLSSCGIVVFFALCDVTHFVLGWERKMRQR